MWGWEEGGVCFKGGCHRLLCPSRHDPGWLDVKFAGRPHFEAVSPQDGFSLANSVSLDMLHSLVLGTQQVFIEGKVVNSNGG